MARPKKKDPNVKVRVAAENRKARFNFEIEDKFEVGIQLTGTEVKSLRATSGNIAESYAEEKNGEIWLINSHIQEFSHGNINNHDPRRIRKLLLHKREIDKLGAAIQRQGMTLVPLSLYFNPQGRVKMELGLARGKKVHDKRQTEKNRDWEKQKGRLLRDKG
ncbi:MAG: SsrA-binding protein SmpB [Sphingomonadales bacterium]|jgi:SsrA-binding protein